jgi:hypothetical protein
VTSANLTHNGLYNNHEWGVIVDDMDLVAQLKAEVLECVEYHDVTEAQVNKMVMFAEETAKVNPSWTETQSIVPTSDICDQVYNQASHSETAPTYWLKPIGHSDEPILKEDQSDFSDLHQELAFSKKGTGQVRAGDILVTTAIGSGCLLTYFQVTGTKKYATVEEQELEWWRKRWPWSIEGRCKAQKYGASWWNYDLHRKVLMDEYLDEYPDRPITISGTQTLGTLNFGNDKVALDPKFGEFLVQKIDEIEAGLT